MILNYIFISTERKEKNDHYHTLNNLMKYNFWKSVTSKINVEFRTNYRGKQCKNKFESLVKEHKVYKQLFTFNYLIILNINIIFIKE